MTGAPGSGKTALLDRLGPEIRVVAEPAREILAEQRAAGGSGVPERDPSLFMELLLQRSIDKYREAERHDGPVVFDRGIPDCIAYAEHFRLDPTPSLEAAERFRARPEVLLLEPWKDIYTVDGERKMSFEATLDFHDQIVDAYRRANYRLVVVPRDSLERRVEFIRESALEGRA